MQINSVANRILGTTGYERRTEAVDVGADALSLLNTAEAGVGGGATNASSRFREILSRYDVRSISPREFSRMAQDLYDSGEISEAEFRKLGQLRLELDLAGREPDEPIDLLAWFQDQIAEQTTVLENLAEMVPQPQNEMAEISKRLERLSEQAGWVSRFALVQESGPQAGIDAAV